MKEGLDVLRMLFYANLLSSEGDTSEVIETERENDERMEVELVNRRQQRMDDPENNEEQSEQQSSGGETTPEVTTPSPASAAGNARSRSTTTARTTSHDKDDNGFAIENALQIKLGLKPNEYRHVRYSFDNFVNDYANDKLEMENDEWKMSLPDL